MSLNHLQNQMIGATVEFKSSDVHKILCSARLHLFNIGKRYCHFK